MITKFLLIAVVAIGASTLSASAQQKRAAKTSSARAYYGNTPSKPNGASYRAKQKKVKKVKTARSQSAKRAMAQSRNRKKFS